MNTEKATTKLSKLFRQTLHRRSNAFRIDGLFGGRRP